MTDEEKTAQQIFWSDVPMVLRWLGFWSGFVIGIITGYPFVYYLWLGLTWG